MIATAPSKGICLLDDEQELEKVLVTGASGFIGSRVAMSGMRRLLRKSDGSLDSVLGDLEDESSLCHACANIDTVFHCAGFAHAFSGSALALHWRVNYQGTKNLLQAAARQGVKRLVFLSSVKAMADAGDECADEDWPGEPSSEYGRAKKAAEDAVLECGREHGMHVVNLRPAMVYGRGGRGNLERMVRGVHAGWFPPLPETGNQRSLLHVSDLVAAMYLAAKTPEANGKTFIVADPVAYSGREIYDEIRKVLSLPAREWSVPSNLMRAGAMVGDWLSALMGRKMPINGEVLDRLLGSACYSPARIKQVLDWQAEVDLARGLSEMTSA